MSLSPIKKILKPQLVIDGAGVEINRVFGGNDTKLTDPFLLLDHLKNDDPDNPIAGFPWHPHRGIETITYMIEGGIHHEDSIGNSGILRSGDVQWMTAGSGIIHQEMPAKDAGAIFHGFQLWANLPSSRKMMDPRYQDIKSGQIPEVVDDDGTKVRVITGSFWGKTGPVTGIVTNPRYLDISLPPNIDRTIEVELDQNAFAYVFSGSGTFKNASLPVNAPTEYVSNEGISETMPALPFENRTLVLFDTGSEIRVQTGAQGMRMLLVSGRPLKEPVAWRGPIVMNTQEELAAAFQEYRDGTFLKHR